MYVVVYVLLYTCVQGRVWWLRLRATPFHREKQCLGSRPSARPS
jgi:hypothetical protein